MKPISAYVTDELDLKAREAALRERRSVSSFVAIALEEKIARVNAAVSQPPLRPRRSNGTRRASA